MDYYTADRLYRYTNSSNLSEPILNYVASRINWGDKVSLMTLAKEIQSKFNDSYVKENTVKGRPKIYADLCLLCMSSRTWQNATSEFGRLYLYWRY